MAKYTVALGERANCFHDQTTGITICKGEKLTLRSAQYSSPRIRQAISAGHLILVQDDAETGVTSKSDIEKLDKKVANQYKKGTTIEKIASSITLEKAKKLAEIHEITVEDTDTVESILKAIFDEE